MTKPAPLFIEIFRAGKHVDMDGNAASFTEADIADIAESYNRDVSEAPLVVGHPEHNAPAYGWVKSLKAEGPLLLAEPHQVDSEFADMVKAGRFKKRSASLISPSAPNHPKPGHWYLRHVGFLGAAAPAVKGLRDCAFAAKAEGVHEFADALEVRWAWQSIANLFSRMRDRIIEQDGLEKADQVLGEWDINAIRDAARPERDAAIPSYADLKSDDTKDNDMTDRTAELAAREAEIAKQKQELADREAVIAEKEKKARREAAVAFVDGASTAGKLLPRFKAPVVELLLALGTTPQLSYADGGKSVTKASDDMLRELIDAMPKQVNFTERAADAIAPVVAFTAPPGNAVDAGRADLHAKALAHKATNPTLSYLDCVRAVGG